MKGAQDWDFHIRLLLNGAKFKHINNCYTTIRNVPNSLSSNWIKINKEACKVVLKLKKKIIDHLDFNDNISQHFAMLFYCHYIYSKKLIHSNSFILKEIQFWSAKNHQFLSPVKRMFVKIFGMNCLMQIERFIKAK